MPRFLVTIPVNVRPDHDGPLTEDDNYATEIRVVVNATSREAAVKTTGLWMSATIQGGLNARAPDSEPPWGIWCTPKPLNDYQDSRRPNWLSISFNAPPCPFTSKAEAEAHIKTLDATHWDYEARPLKPLKP